MAEQALRFDIGDADGRTAGRGTAALAAVVGKHTLAALGTSKIGFHDRFLLILTIGVEVSSFFYLGAADSANAQWLVKIRSILVKRPPTSAEQWHPN